MATASILSLLISTTTSSAGEVYAPEPSVAPPRSFTTTLAPCEAKARASPRPMPRPAPVTIATLPASLLSIVALLRHSFPTSRQAADHARQRSRHNEVEPL